MFVIEDWDASGFPGDIWVTEGGGGGVIVGTKHLLLLFIRHSSRGRLVHGIQRVSRGKGWRGWFIGCFFLML